MFTMTFTSTVGTKISHASQAPMSDRIMSNMPRPLFITATLDAESSVKITIGMT